MRTSEDERKEPLSPTPNNPHTDTRSSDKEEDQILHRKDTRDRHTSNSRDSPSKDKRTKHERGHSLPSVKREERSGFHFTPQPLSTRPVTVTVTEQRQRQMQQSSVHHRIKRITITQDTASSWQSKVKRRRRQ